MLGKSHVTIACTIANIVNRDLDEDYSSVAAAMSSTLVPLVVTNAANEVAVILLAVPALSRSDALCECARHALCSPTMHYTDKRAGTKRLCTGRSHIQRLAAAHLHKSILPTRYRASLLNEPIVSSLTKFRASAASSSAVER